MPDSRLSRLSPLTRRPAVVAVALLVSGILFHESAAPRPGLILLWAIVLLVSAVLALRLRFVCSMLLAGCAFLTGLGLAQREHYQFPADDIGQFATDEPALVQLRLYLPDDPTLSSTPPGQPFRLPPKNLVTAEVRAVKTWAGWAPASGELPVTIEVPAPVLRGGQTVETTGMIQRPQPAQNPGEFDFAAYYRRQRITAIFAVKHAESIHVLSDPGTPWVVGLRWKIRRLLSRGFKSADAAQQMLLSSLLLGDHDPAGRPAVEEFREVGLGYELSVNGLHIAVLAAVLFWFLLRLKLPPRGTLLICTGFVLAYAIVALPSHSGWRAAVLAILVAVSTQTRRSADRLQLLSIAIFAALIAHPLDIYSPGFQLSFSVVGGFIILLPKMRFSFRRGLRALPKRAPSRWQRRLRMIGARLGQSAQLGMIAWATTLPLVAYHFGQVTLWSILLGVVLLPVVVIALLTGAAKVGLTALFPSTAWAWVPMARWPIVFMQWVVHRGTQWPGASIVVATPSIPLILIFYALLLAPTLPRWKFLDGRRRLFLWLAPLLGVMLILFRPIGQPATQSVSGVPSVRLTLLSIGAGQCGILEVPGAAPVMIDVGSSTVPDVGRKAIEPFLSSAGRNDISRIFLSHGDFDHISAAAELVGDYSVRDIFISRHFRENSAGNLPDEEVLDLLESRGIAPHEIQTGDHFALGDSGAALDVLWPPAEGKLNSNNAGLVMRVTFAGRSILLPADIQDPAFAGLLKRPELLQSDVLVAPHHGSAEPLTPAFLAAVHAREIVASSARRLTGKQKTFDKLVGGTPFFRTGDSGAITITIYGDGRIVLTTYNGKSLRL